MSTISILRKIWEVVQEAPEIKKNEKTKNYKYADLQAHVDKLLPLIKKAGLGYVQYTDVDNDTNHIVTRVFEEDTNDEACFEATLAVPKVKLQVMNEFQTLGAAITYYRRYQLGIIFGAITDEDVDMAKATPQITSTDFFKKLETLINAGRKVSTLETYYKNFEPQLTEEEQKKAKAIINIQKEKEDANK